MSANARLVKLMLKRARDRAGRRGIPYALTARDIIIPRRCPVLGLPLYRTPGRKAQTRNTPTIDRINPRKGYVPGNVQVISARANQIKSDATPKELMQVACYYMEHGPEDYL